MKKVLLVMWILLSNTMLFAENQYALTSTKLNLRQENSINSNSLKILNEGDTIEILSSSQDWTRVRVDDLEGFVSTEFIQKLEPTAKEESENKTFQDQKGFVQGFKFVFIRIFILIFLIAGSIITFNLRKKDARFKKGYREGKMSNLATIKLMIYSGIISLLAGFIGGIICLFH